MKVRTHIYTLQTSSKHGSAVVRTNVQVINRNTRRPFFRRDEGQTEFTVSKELTETDYYFQTKFLERVKKVDSLFHALLEFKVTRNEILNTVESLDIKYERKSKIPAIGNSSKLKVTVNVDGKPSSSTIEFPSEGITIKAAVEAVNPEAWAESPGRKQFFGASFRYIDESRPNVRPTFEPKGEGDGIESKLYPNAPARKEVPSKDCYNFELNVHIRNVDESVKMRTMIENTIFKDATQN
ncbi:hypothetical protein DdX_14387 [Ditylenchus destructor]|uniref:Uncharacterized protein n=1 Tax=Ditylenchus destructor TaxID=166010 RepID=A0AAD4MSA2_9BILA|nr:hypothetical protein DdX_14387 [Ditylenchus destructor]